MSDQDEQPSALPEEFDVPSGGVFVSGGPEGIGESVFEDLAPEPAMETASGPDVDPGMEFRRTLGRFATGVTVITTRANDQVHGMTANAFMSVSLKPPLVLISVDKLARTHALLHVGKTFGVSVLAHDQVSLSDHFAGRTGEAPEYRFEFIHDTPLVEGAVAHLVAQVDRTYWGGDHSLFLGRVEYTRGGEGRPLLFHGGRYERLPLADVPILAALSPEARQVILDAGQERTYAAGETIVAENDPGDALFVILEGSAGIERAGRTVAHLSAGDFFGEVSVLDGGPRTADVVAETPVRCLAVARDLLRRTLLAEPTVAWAMLESLAARLRGT